MVTLVSEGVFELNQSLYFNCNCLERADEEFVRLHLSYVEKNLPTSVQMYMNIHNVLSLYVFGVL